MIGEQGVSLEYQFGELLGLCVTALAEPLPLGVLIRLAEQTICLLKAQGGVKGPGRGAGRSRPARDKGGKTFGAVNGSRQRCTKNEGL